MIVSVASSVENSGGTTLAWQIARSLETTLNDMKFSPFSEDRVYYLEADPAGGVMSRPLGAPHDVAEGMNRVLSSPRAALPEMETMMWRSKLSVSDNLFFALLAGTNTLTRALGNAERELAEYLGDIPYAFSVVDAGRVLGPRGRPLLTAADLVLYVVDLDHSASLLRASAALKSLGSSSVSSIGRPRHLAFATKGELTVFPDVLADELGCEHAGHLPPPVSRLGGAPHVKYRTAVDQICRRFITKGISPLKGEERKQAKKAKKAERKDEDD